VFVKNEIKTAIYSAFKI